MILPTKLKIGAIWWHVKLVDPLEIDSDNSVCGDTSPETQTIRLNKHLSEAMLEQTFLHELLHAINLQLDHNAVEMLATILHQVLTENNLLN